MSGVFPLFSLFPSVSCVRASPPGNNHERHVRTIMLRIRLREALPAVCTPAVPFPISIHLTNESGSNVHVSAPVRLRFLLVDVDASTPITSFEVAVHSAAASDKTTTNIAATDLLGRCNVMVSLVPKKKRRRDDECKTLTCRIQVTLDLLEPVYLSPVASPSFWPVILLADDMYIRDVEKLQPGRRDAASTLTKSGRLSTLAVSAPVDSEAAKRDEKKRRSAAFAAKEWLLTEDLTEESQFGRELVVAASVGADVEAVGVVQHLPLLTNALSIQVTSESIPATCSNPSLDAQIVTVPLRKGLHVRLFERQTLVGPGFGTVVWDCAVVLAQYLFHHADALNLKGARVCDNATGTGFVALALAALGSRVTATDIGSVTAFAVSNIALNAGLIADGGGSVTVVEHYWGSDVMPVLTADSDKFDYIISSEVVYDTALFRPLIASLIGLSDGSVKVHPDGSKSSPVLLIAGKRRAGCELGTFLTELSQHFTVEPLSLLNTDSPPTVQAVAFGCCGMSKTKYPPLLFRCVRK